MPVNNKTVAAPLGYNYYSIHEASFENGGFEVMRKLFSQFGSYLPFTMFLKECARQYKVNTDRIKLLERNPLDRVIEVASAVQNSETDMTLTLVASNRDDNGKIPIRAGETWFWTNSAGERIEVYCTSATAYNAVNVISVNTNKVINGITTGDYLTLGSSLKAYGTATRAGKHVGEDDFDYYVQSFDTSKAWEGIEGSRPRYFDEIGEKEYQRMIAEGEIELEMDKETAAVFGQAINNDSIVGTSALTAANNKPLKTVGFFELANTYGTEMTYDLSDGFSSDDLYDVSDLLVKNGVNGNVVLLAGGQGFLNNISKGLGTQLVGSGNYSDSFVKQVTSDLFGGRETLVAQFGFQGVQLGRHTFVTYPIGAFNNGYRMGNAVHNAYNEGMAIPFETTTVRFNGKVTTLPNLLWAYIPMRGKVNHIVPFAGMDGTLPDMPVVNADYSSISYQSRGGAVMPEAWKVTPIKPVA